MRLWVVSDLHADSTFWVPNRIPRHDVLIIAGDVDQGVAETEQTLLLIAKWRPTTIIFVPGNHDVLGGDIDAWDRGNEGLLDAGIHVLSSGQSVVIDGVRFVGATLWTDWHLHDTEFASQAWAARSMPEYQHVLSPDGGKLWPIHTSSAHDQHRAAIEAVLATPHDGPTVVVTHHAPSVKSIRGPLEEASAAFASDLEDIIVRYRPALWVHGHIHSASDYWIGGTRVLCNARGYEGHDWYEDSGFVEHLVVEV